MPGRPTWLARRALLRIEQTRKAVGLGGVGEAGGGNRRADDLYHALPREPRTGGRAEDGAERIGSEIVQGSHGARDRDVGIRSDFDGLEVEAAAAGMDQERDRLVRCSAH